MTPTTFFAPTLIDESLRDLLDAITARAASDPAPMAIRRVMEDAGFFVDTAAKIPGDGAAPAVKLAALAVRRDVMVVFKAFEVDPRPKDIARLVRSPALKIAVVRRSSATVVPAGLDAMIVLEPFVAPTVTASAAKSAPLPLVWIERGSPEYAAWCEHHGKPALFTSRPSKEIREGRYERSQWPPGREPRVHPPPARDGPQAAMGQGRGL